MSEVLEPVGFVLVLIGAAFCMIGGIGLLRMPDFYTRAHASGVTDTFGAGFILVGLMLHAPGPEVAIKLAMALAFMLVTGPVATHALAKAAYAQGFVVDGAPIDVGSDVSDVSDGEVGGDGEAEASPEEDGRGAAG